MTTVADALQHAMARGLARLDAQMLLLHALGRRPHDRAWLLAHDADPVDAAANAVFDNACQRRAGGEPAAYIVGHKEFHGLTLQVDPRVLVPRPDTETLVDWALELLPRGGAVLDLGTGSGAIALALRHARPDAVVTATDRSPDALAVAQSNARRLQLTVHFVQADWWLGLAGGPFDVIVSNPPYIAAHDPHLTALGHEPTQALVAGQDGLDDLRVIVAGACAWLRPGGWLLLEHGHDQSGTVRGLLDQHGFDSAASRADLAGIERCAGGRRPIAG